MSASQNDPIRVEHTDDGDCILELNRPASRNSLNLNTLERLNCELEKLEGQRSTRILVITGSGRAFCAGADLGELDGASPELLRTIVARGQEVISRLQSFPGLTIAAVNGIALGGGFELALACDIRWSTKTAVLALPECGHGLAPAWGGISLIHEKLPSAIAREVLLLNRKLTAQRAYDLGLVTRILGADFETALRDELRLAQQSIRLLPGDFQAVVERARTCSPPGEGGRHDLELFLRLRERQSSSSQS